jgi:ribonuclease D
MVSGEQVIDATPLVATDHDFARVCARFAAADVIGIDTEFVRERTYHPRPGVIQVVDPSGITLIDPLALTSFEPLRQVLANPSLVTLIHACDEDLELLKLLTDTVPVRVFDTQLAGAFAGYGYSLGYRDLVLELLGATLDKGETRSDWCRRPLSATQLRYAALDVAHLPSLYERLSTRLVALGRNTWLEQEFQYRRAVRTADKEPDRAYLRVKRRGTLAPDDHAVLRALSAWREREAQARDIPRRHLLTDEALIELSTIRVFDGAALRRVGKVLRQVPVKSGEELVPCAEAARRAGPSSLDRHVRVRVDAEATKRLKSIVREVADTLGLPQELVANRRALEGLVIAVSKERSAIPAEFLGWRYDLVTTRLLESL